jgi:hypothetical protein
MRPLFHSFSCVDAGFSLQWFKVHVPGCRTGLKHDPAIPAPVACEVRLLHRNAAVPLCRCRIPVLFFMCVGTNFQAGEDNHRHRSHGILQAVTPLSVCNRELVLVLWVGQ